MYNKLVSIMKSWDVVDLGNGKYEANTLSPLGAKIILPLSGRTLSDIAESAKSEYHRFDAGDHAACILYFQKHGNPEERKQYENFPSSWKKLVADARNIEDRLMGAWRGLEAAVKREEQAEWRRKRENLKGCEVWVVLGADPKSDEPGYHALAEIYADKEDARKALRRAAEQDAEVFDDKIEWYDKDSDHEWCEVYCNGEPRTTYCLETCPIK